MYATFYPHHFIVDETGDVMPKKSTPRLECDEEKIKEMDNGTCLNQNCAFTSTGLMPFNTACVAYDLPAGRENIYARFKAPYFYYMIKYNVWIMLLFISGILYQCKKEIKSFIKKL
ncbi:hypothetical protein DRH27_03775 [Candidatus Falkowbacteria bacterium]|nr:MAG: hypothetical protein DRH27_03775 [Candidatus Falkowbacteria bacterium]